MNAVTKSGTNEFHGDAFEFMRDHRFNAIRYFERTENGGLGRDDGLKRHQFGGTIGGPIMRDRLFFFFGVQATNNFNVPLNTDFTVPTAEVLRGDFRRIMSAGLPGQRPATLGRAVREQPGRPGVVPPDLAEDDGDVAGGGSGERSRTAAAAIRSACPMTRKISST